MEKNTGTQGLNRAFRPLRDKDKLRITELFTDTMVPKLRRLQARIGILNCRFAGEDYRAWNLRFKSAGPDFQIVAFEYDEDARSMDLDL